MQTLYIDRKDTHLKVDRDRLLVHNDYLQKPLSIAFSYLSSIVISATTQLSSQLLLACAKKNIAVIVLDPRSAEHHAQYIPANSGIVHRKIKQFSVFNQPEKLLTYAQRLVHAHALQQLKLIHDWQRQHYLLEEQAKAFKSRIKTTLVAIKSSQNVEELRGLEGSTAKVVFQAMAIVAPTWCKFTSRNRRPPLDPINVLLSLSYTLLHAECSQALKAHAFDPMLGFYHEPLHGRDSLACDLAERVRTEIEKWVLQLLIDGHFQAQHFSSSEQYPCILSKEGRAIFYPLWQQKVKSLKKYLRLNVQHWLQILDQDEG